MIPVPFTIIFFLIPYLPFFSPPIFSIFSPYTSRRQFICIDQAFLSKPSIFDLNLKKPPPNLSLLPDETRDRDLNSASSSF